MKSKIKDLFLLAGILCLGFHVAEAASKKVRIRLAKPICGDCCIEKLTNIQGMLTLEDVKVGDPNVVVVYDDEITNPEKIIASLEEKGKKARILEDVSVPENTGAQSSSNQSGEIKWAKPIRSKGR